MGAVRLLPWDPAWPQQAAAALDALRPFFAGEAVSFEPIGSTAVPGLCAKPVLDLMLGLPDLAVVEARIEALRAAGWRYRPEHEALLPARRYFTHEAGPGGLRLHLHALLQGGEPWRQHLAFRDALRERADWRARYAALKQELAARHAGDKSAYQDAKAPFIRACLAALHPHT